TEQQGVEYQHNSQLLPAPRPCFQECFLAGSFLIDQELVIRVLKKKLIRDDYVPFLCGEFPSLYLPTCSQLSSPPLPWRVVNEC
uniref:Uncharacterized protein n=1 Tax=Saimiri boliviensis boliviensis TaxID=39432 RepID=A0A2K6T8D3_SAIBB